MMEQQKFDGNVSRRGWSNVEGIMPQIRAAVEEREKQHAAQNATVKGLQPERDEPAPIDLSTAENWLLRDEMLQLCRQKVANHLEGQHLSYPGGLAGDPDLLTSLAEFFNDHFKPHIPVLEHHLAVAPGAAGCLDALIYNICDAGDGILIPAPCWNAFDFILRARTAIIPIPVATDTLEASLSMLLIDALGKALAQAQCKIRALLLVNPNNPLGRCYPLEVVQACIKFCESHDLHFISDEIYALTSYRTPDVPETDTFVSALSLDISALSCNPSRVHTVWSISKDLGYNGLRMVGPIQFILSF